MIDHDATDQLAALRAGTVTARELMAQTLDRIDRLNPALNAIVALRDRDTLLDEAEYATPGPLQGLPMAIKDLAETAGIVTSYGSPAFRDNVPDEDSPMVARLRRAGAVIIGKTNTPEFGLGSHSYNPVYGVTRNPYDLTRSAGGSSGGAGAALASRMVALADGSDMMGSLRNPAGWNNVFGFRPSYGLVAGGGPGDLFLAQLSTEGPMARSIRDLELLLAIQSEHDPRHPHSSGPYRNAGPRCKLKIGWLSDWGGAYATEPGVLELCEAAVGVFETLGHSVTVLPPPFPADALWQAWTVRFPPRLCKNPYLCYAYPWFGGFGWQVSSKVSAGIRRRFFRSVWTSGSGKITLRVWSICSLTSSICPRSGFNAMPPRARGGRGIIRLCC
jgi:amidase